MFIVNDDGISFRGMDAAHISLLDVTFPKSSFEELIGDTDFFGLKVNELKTIFNTASTNDIIELGITDQNIMKVLIEGSLNMEYNIKLLVKQEVNTPIPKIEPEAKISVNPNILFRVFSNLKIMSDHVKIETNPNRIQFSGRGDSGNAKIDIKKGDPELNFLETEGEIASVYSLEYVADIIREIGKASKKVNMEYASQNPMHMTFEMPSNVKVNYYVAPRLEQ